MNHNIFNNFFTKLTNFLNNNNIIKITDSVENLNTSLFYQNILKSFTSMLQKFEDNNKTKYFYELLNNIDFSTTLLDYSNQIDACQSLPDFMQMMFRQSALRISTYADMNDMIQISPSYSDICFLSFLNSTNDILDDLDNEPMTTIINTTNTKQEKIKDINGTSIPQVQLYNIGTLRTTDIDISFNSNMKMIKSELWMNILAASKTDSSSLANPFFKRTTSSWLDKDQPSKTLSINLAISNVDIDLNYCVSAREMRLICWYYNLKWDLLPLHNIASRLYVLELKQRLILGTDIIQNTDYKKINLFPLEMFGSDPAIVTHVNVRYMTVSDYSKWRLSELENVDPKCQISDCCLFMPYSALNNPDKLFYNLVTVLPCPITFSNFQFADVRKLDNNVETTSTLSYPYKNGNTIRLPGRTRIIIVVYDIPEIKPVILGYGNNNIVQIRHITDTTTEENFMDYIKYQSYKSYSNMTVSYEDFALNDTQLKIITDAIYSPLPTIVDTLQLYFSLSDVTCDMSFINLKTSSFTSYLNAWESLLKHPTGKNAVNGWNSCCTLYDTDFVNLFLTTTGLISCSYTTSINYLNPDSISVLHIINRIILSLINYTFDYLSPASSYVRCQDNNQTLLNTITTIMNLLIAPKNKSHPIARTNINNQYHLISSNSTGYYTTSCNNIIDFLCSQTNTTGPLLKERLTLTLDEDVVAKNDGKSFIFRWTDNSKTTGKLFQIIDRLIPLGQYTISLNDEINNIDLPVRFYIMSFKPRLFIHTKDPSATIIIGRNPNYPKSLGSNTGNILLPMINNSQCSNFSNAPRRFKIESTIPMTLVGGTDVTILSNMLTKKIFNNLYNTSCLSSTLQNLSLLNEIDDEGSSKSTELKESDDSTKK